MFDLDDIERLQYNMRSKCTSEDPFWNTPPPVHPICLHPDFPPFWKDFGYRVCYMCITQREIEDYKHVNNCRVTDRAFLEAIRQVFKYGPFAPGMSCSQVNNSSLKRCPHCQTQLCYMHMEKKFSGAPRTNVHGIPIPESASVPLPVPVPPLSTPVPLCNKKVSGYVSKCLLCDKNVPCMLALPCRHCVVCETCYDARKMFSCVFCQELVYEYIRCYTS